jgi:HlyD family secretion protein
MLRNSLFVVLSLVLLFFAIGHAIYIQRPEPDEPPPVPPPTSPYGHTVAGVGMVEPSTPASGTGNIALGSQVAGLVTRVWARLDEEVKAGDLLIELDKRQAGAEWKVRQAALAAAQAQLRKLELQPRPEEVPVSEAQVRSAEANVHLQLDQYERAKKLVKTNAMSYEDYFTRKQAYLTGLAQLEYARANLALLKAGAWEADKAIAYAAVKQAEAQVDQAKTNLDLLQIRAPVDGTILQINVRPGEYVSTASGQITLLMMGNLHPYHVRVNVDEEDLSRLKLKAPARAKIRGDLRQETVPLWFVRLEPYIVPKTSLTGINTERVDTRVVQVIYALDPQNRLVRDKKILVGQLLDVFIDAGPEASAGEKSGNHNRARSSGINE